MVTLPSGLVATNFGTCWYQCSLSNVTTISAHMLQCSWAHTVSCFSMWCSFASIGTPIQCPLLSHQNVDSLHLLSVSVCNIYIAWHFVVTPFFAATISRSVSPSKSPPYSHSNMSSSLTICLSVLLTYWQCVTLLPRFSFKYSPHITFCVVCLPLCVTVAFDYFNSSTTSTAVLIVQFIFGW